MRYIAGMRCRQQTKVVDVCISVLKIKLNENHTVSRSMRLYLDTYERFNAFCKSNNKDKRVQDILDSALREFLDKYMRNMRRSR